MINRFRFANVLSANRQYSTVTLASMRVELALYFTSDIVNIIPDFQNRYLRRTRVLNRQLLVCKQGDGKCKTTGMFSKFAYCYF